MEEETGSMQVECRDQGLVQPSSRPSKQINRPTAVFQQSLSVKEEEDEPSELDDVVQLESPTTGSKKQNNF